MKRVFLGIGVSRSLRRGRAGKRTDNYLNSGNKMRCAREPHYWQAAGLTLLDLEAVIAVRVDVLVAGRPVPGHVLIVHRRARGPELLDRRLAFADTWRLLAGTDDRFVANHLQVKRQITLQISSIVFFLPVQINGHGALFLAELFSPAAFPAPRPRGGEPGIRPFADEVTLKLRERPKM